MENFAPPNLKRICLVRLSALGDVCLVVPLVRTLQHAFPQATITWITTGPMLGLLEDRKSTRLNSSHLGISYAVFCLKKKKKKKRNAYPKTNITARSATPPRTVSVR